MSKKLIFCLLGKSAVGKDTMVDLVYKLNRRVEKLVPITTRPPRSFEKDGVQYHFITKDFFQKKLKAGAIMEHREYSVINKKGASDKWIYGHEYPTSDISIMSGPLSMYTYIKSFGDFEVVPIYITIPDEERLFRMVRRELRNTNPNVRETCRRFVADNKDFPEDIINSICPKENIFVNENRSTTSESINQFINNYINNFEGKWFMWLRIWSVSAI